MNESEKNIETCLPESILAEVASVPTDPQFVSLVNESLDPLKQQAFQQAGSDAYNEVVKSHQPYTFTSSVRQMKSNLILLLRRFWRFPFGTGTIRSLSDMWAHYITRLQGSETYGIPSRLDQLTDLPSAPVLLSDRTISGVPDAVDGMSMARILFDSSLNITELLDDNVWGDFGSPSKISSLASMLPSLETLHIGCKKLTASVSLNLTTIKDLWLDNCEEALNFSLSGGCYYHVPKLKKVTTTSIVLNGWVNPDGDVDWPEVESVNSQRVAWTGGYPTRVLAPKLTDFYNTEGIFQASSVLPTTTMIFGAVTRFPGRFIQQNSNNLMSNLMHLEFGAGTAISLNLSQWGAENCLDTEDHKALFLSNFRDYIALRLTDNGSGKTLTLSQAVRNAIHAAEATYGIENIIITQKGWTISPAPN